MPRGLSSASPMLRLAAMTAAAALALITLPTAAVAADAAPPTPGVPCDSGSLPETTQGRVPLADVTSGRAAKGYTCNSRELAHFGNVGGYQVHRYVDKAGHECAYFDSTLLIGRDAVAAGSEGTGTYVMDMTDPAAPKHVDTLRTPAFQSPHETVRVNQKRGLIVAALSTLATNAGVVDVFDISQDCRKPVLVSSTPLGVLGHESGFSPDGNTFYVSSLYFRTLAAVDLTNPLLPSLVWFTYDYSAHGMSVSDDGSRLYMAEAGLDDGDFSGLTILDVSQVQKRTVNPSVPVVSRTTWPNVGTPQYAEPFTRNGRPYLMEIDEFGGGANVGAGRIIDLSNEKKPVVISNLRLAVNQEKAQSGDQMLDPGVAGQRFQGYRAHYCSIPTRVDPTTVACTFIISGLRIFDIADLRNPQEIAYFNGKIVPSDDAIRQSAYAMSAPVYIPERREVWYSDANLGFYAVRLTAAAKRAVPVAGPATPPRQPAPAAPGGSGAGPVAAPGQLPATGLPVAVPALALLCLGVVVARRRRAATS